MSAIISPPSATRPGPAPKPTLGSTSTLIPRPWLPMARGQTCDVHSAQIRGSLGLRLYAASDAEPLQVFLVQRAMHRDDAGILIAEAAIGLWSFVPGPRVQGV